MEILFPYVRANQKGSIFVDSSVHFIGKGLYFFLHIVILAKKPHGFRNIPSVTKIINMQCEVTFRILKTFQHFLLYT